MKVLFAVSNEEISESIVKKYQKEYKQIISYKNVYYFNAILKELQKDKTYDRIVISEDLEAFTNTQYDQIDKFIFEKLDGISDEATDAKGNDTPIILICSDRRAKSDPMLVKLFGIGVYDAIIGNDRSVDEVCRLINRPRTKKEAKSYYKIDSEDVGYQTENENDVSEMEIQNIVAHYKRLGKNEDRYIDSFNNIAAQYNDTQLRIISKFLPLNVRAVLEERSPKYQKIMSFNNTISDSLRKGKDEEDDGPSQVLLKSKNRETVLSKPVVIPSAVNMNETKKLARQRSSEPTKAYTQQSTIQTPKVKPEQPVMQQYTKLEQPTMQQYAKPEQPTMQQYVKPEQPVTQQYVEQEQPIAQQYVEPEQSIRPQNIKPDPIIEGFEDLEDILRDIPEETIQPQPTKQMQQSVTQPIMQETVVQEIAQPVKRGRGRPRKNPVSAPTEIVSQPQPAKRGRGRPRKNPVPVPEVEQQPEEEMVLPGLEPQEQEPEENFLPGFYDVDTEVPQTTSVAQTETATFLPGFDDEDNEPEEDMILPGLGIEDLEEDEEPEIPEPITTQQFQPQSDSVMNNNYEFNSSYKDNNDYNNNSYYTDYNSNFNANLYGSNNRGINKEQQIYEEIDLSPLLTPDKKIVTFVGTSKNGTSFIVNNIAELTSSMGINTVILDTTQNRNSYYIYTKNEEPLRELATHSIEGLTQGIAKGISVNRNLTVYTSLPDENDTINHVDKILETLLQNHSLILIDTDFDTPLGYFKQSQETYLVQSMDILTIQPLTAFLKELKVKNILDEKKLRIVLNKTVKIRGIKDETIIGGMAFYNDPAMSFMTELFDRDRVKYVSIPFEEETYIRYLEGIIECEISLKGYSKMFVQTLKVLGNMIYPTVTSTPRNNRNYQPPSAQMNGGGNFSSNMNDTLNKMKNF